MTTYRISNRTSGADLGIFDGETPLDALKALSRDCGYSSLEDEADTLGTTVEELIADMRCDEVDDTAGHVYFADLHPDGYTVYLATDMDEALELMAEYDISELPVLRGFGQDEIETSQRLVQ